VKFRVIQDDSRPQGGYAIVLVQPYHLYDERDSDYSVVSRWDDDAIIFVYRVRDQQWLSRHGWRREADGLTPENFSVVGDELRVILGPDIVDRLQAGEELSIELCVRLSDSTTIRVSERLKWPNIRPSAATLRRPLSVESMLQWRSTIAEARRLESETASVGSPIVAAQLQKGSGRVASPIPASRASSPQLPLAQREATFGPEPAAPWKESEESYDDEVPPSRRIVLVIAALVGAIAMGGGMALLYKLAIGGKSEVREKELILRKLEQEEKRLRGKIREHEKTLREQRNPVDRDKDNPVAKGGRDGGPIFPPPIAPGTRTDLVDCSVFAPASAPPGEAVLVQVFFHLPQQYERVGVQANLMDTATSLRSVKTLQTEIQHGAGVDVALSCKGLEIEEPQQTLVWRGEPVFAQFLVSLPEGSEGKSYFPIVRITVDGHLQGRVVFRLLADPRARGPSLPNGVRAGRYRYAFVSYASGDRQEVLKRVQMFEVVKTDYFQDLLSLDPGVRWEKELYKHIDECDLFLLFWSQAAKDSEWVIREAEYALARQGPDGEGEPDIVPVILEGPPPVPPPDSLNAIHFNDRVNYFIAASTDRSSAKGIFEI
jgi:hypothetical protein